MISSHVKITCYLHMWKYHRCYGYIINRAFHTKKLLKWNGLVFHWCLYNKYNITWLLRDTKFLFSCWKNISRVSVANKWNIFQHSKRNFVSPRSYVISSTSYHHTCIVCMYWVKLLIKELKIYVVVNFLFQVIFVFLLFLGMLILC